MCQSVVGAATGCLEQPENEEYITVTARHIITLLPVAAAVHPHFATYALRAACGRVPSPRGARLTAYLAARDDDFFGAILDVHAASASPLPVPPATPLRKELEPAEREAIDARWRIARQKAHVVALGLEDALLDIDCTVINQYSSCAHFGRYEQRVLHSSDGWYVQKRV